MVTHNTPRRIATEHMVTHCVKRLFTTGQFCCYTNLWTSMTCDSVVVQFKIGLLDSSGPSVADPMLHGEEQTELIVS